MKRTLMMIAVLAALIPPARAARADDTFHTAARADDDFGSTAREDADVLLAGGVTGFESISYRPRRYDRYPRPSYRSGNSGAESQLHIGFFDPSRFSSVGVVFGFRGGAVIDEHVSIGVDVDWHYKSDRQTAVVSEQSLPTGGTAQVTRILSRASSNLVPVLGYVQISGGRDMPVIPYAGAGVGYEAYFLSADDFNTGAHFDAQYGGFAWQAWAGAQLPLSGRSRLVGEVYTNQAELGRDVDISGQTFRETVNLDGVGMRFGVNWGF